MKKQLTDFQVLEIFSRDETANDPQVFELEKELSEGFTRELTIDDKREILSRAGRIK